VAKRRDNGEGSIYQRQSDGRWVVQYPMPGHVKRIYKYCKSKQEALDVHKELVAADITKTYIGRNNIKLSEWLDYWMRVYIEGNVSTNWYARKKDMIRIHINPELGQRVMQKITPLEIKEFYKKLAKSGNKNICKNEAFKMVGDELSPQSIKHIHNILKPAFYRAVDDGIIGHRENPMTRINPPKVVKKRKPQTLAEEDIAKYLEPLSRHRLYAAYVLELSSGLRRGELLGLYRTDLDIETGVLTVNTQLQRIKKEEGGSSLEITEVLKTDGSARSIVLPPCVLNEIELHIGRQEEEKRKAGSLYHDEGLLFCGLLGNRLDTRRLYELHCKALEKAELEHIRFHDLRHTFATLMLEKGENIKTIQELLGHKDITTTLNMYTHVLSKMKAASARKMESVMCSILAPRAPVNSNPLNGSSNL